MYCKVKHCRYPESHVTSVHRCGKCAKPGHGQIECGNSEQIANLSIDDEQFPHSCTMEICYHRNTHINAAHHCEYFECGGNHSI